jgi:hypothetical protein
LLIACGSVGGGSEDYGEEDGEGRSETIAQSMVGVMGHHAGMYGWVTIDHMMSTTIVIFAYKSTGLGCATI